MTKTIAVGWFPVGQLEQALALWPGLVAGWGVNGYADYCHHIDRQLRALELADDTHIVLSPIEVKAYIRWCKNMLADSGEPDARSRYAAEVATRGRARPWPPPAGKQCWCGRDEAYEECCGRP